MKADTPCREVTLKQQTEVGTLEFGIWTTSANSFECYMKGPPRILQEEKPVTYHTRYLTFLPGSESIQPRRLPGEWTL